MVSRGLFLRFFFLLRTYPISQVRHVHHFCHSPDPPEREFRQALSTDYGPGAVDASINLCLWNFIITNHVIQPLSPPIFLLRSSF